MTRSKWAFLGTVGMGLAVCVLALQPGLGARQAAVAIDDDDIGGVVTGPNGPEAGVWVIAETMDLPTRFNRTVVTDDEGRYVVPDLPEATYDVLGARLRSRRLAQAAGVAGDPRRSHRGGRARRAGGGAVLPVRLLVRAARGAGARGVPGDRSGRQRHLAERAEPGGVAARPEVGRVHRLPRASGARPRARFPPELGEFDSLVAAWDRRIQSGQAGGSMSNGLDRMGRRRALEIVRRLDRPHHGRRGAGPRRRRGPRGSSATWSSPSGTGPIRRPTCTTRRRPTSATPP